ncbi:MAG: cytochrome c biogenesis protein [Coriobacteriia bacterium]|nr:cytochrome c biogenesis protein [Coriobacteriia bacterium]
MADILYGLVWVGGLALTGLSILSLGLPRFAGLGRPVLVATWLAATVALAIRWSEVGHPPIFGTFENTYAASWSVLFACVVASFTSRAPKGLGQLWRIGSPWVVALMLYGSRFRSDPVPLTISEQSLWVDVHVLFAWLAFVPFLLAATMAVLMLFGFEPFGLTRQSAEERMTQMVLVGFAAFTAMLLTGSFYLYVLFGTFWQWEIVETLSLLTWIAYGLAIHARLFYRWGGRGFYLAMTVILPLMLAAYLVWSVFPNTFHFFDVPLVRPY